MKKFKEILYTVICFVVAEATVSIILLGFLIKLF